MIGWIVSLLSGTIGRALLGALAIGGAWLAVKVYYEGKGAQRERTAIVEAGQKNARKSREARRRVERIPDGPSLRDRYFRD